MAIGDSDEAGRELVPMTGETMEPGEPPEPAGDPDEVEAAELINLVNDVPTKDLEVISERVRRTFDADVKSRAPYMKRCAKWKKLYHLATDPKSFPFAGCANLATPLLATTVLQIHARLYDMVWPADGMVLQSKPSTATEEEINRAWRTEVFGNHYLRRDMPDYEIGIDDSLWQVVIFGSCFRFRAWDPVEGRIVVRWIPIDDFVVPYTERCTDPSMRGVPRYSWIRRLSLNELETYRDAGGYFDNIEALRKAAASPQGDSRSEMKRVTDKVAGVEPPAESLDIEVEPRRIIEQYCWLKLPKSKKKLAKSRAFDGKMHPMVVDVDEQTGTVLRVALREEPDPRDARRFAREMQQFEAEVQQAAAVVEANVRRDELRARDVLDIYEADELMTLEAGPETAPVPEPPKAQRTREICYFGHMRAFPNEGFYGTGFGDLVGPLNEASNQILNEVINAMTLQNAGGGFISTSLTGPKGDIGVQPGKYTRVNGSPQSIAAGIQHHKFPGPSPVAMPMADTIVSMSHQLSASGSIFSGEKGSSHETATTSKIRLEQAIKQISVLSRRMVAFMRHEFEAIWRLFSVFLDEDDAAEVVNAEGMPVTIPISRADFVPDANVTPSANPMVGSRQQRIDEATDRLAMLMQNPVTQAMGPVIMKATEDVLRAQGAYEYVSMIKTMQMQQQQAQMQAQQPPPPIPQYEENVAMLRGEPAQINDQDDDAEHVSEIEQFTQTPAFQEAPPPTKAMLAQHRLEHLGQGYVKQRRAANVRPNVVGVG